MRCDSGQPGCLICAAYGDTCHYDKAPPVSQIVNMAKRLQQLEELMNQLKTSDNEDVLRIVESVEHGGQPSIDGTSPRRSSFSSSTQDPSLQDLRRSNSTSKPESSLGGEQRAPSLSTELSMSADGQVSQFSTFCITPWQIMPQKSTCLTVMSVHIFFSPVAILWINLRGTSTCGNAANAFNPYNPRYGPGRFEDTTRLERITITNLGRLCLGKRCFGARHSTRNYHQASRHSLDMDSSDIHVCLPTSLYE